MICKREKEIDREREREREREKERRKERNGGNINFKNNG